MNTQRIKVKLISFLGYKATAYVQAMRFVYLLKVQSRLEPELKIVQCFLKNGDTVVDVGANGADWTYGLHQCVRPGGFVYSFEADPYYAMATAIAIRLLRLSGVCLFPFGLSDREEEAPLRIVDPNGLRSSGLGYVDKQVSNSDAGIQMVRLKMLDSLSTEYPKLLNTTLIKCDVEGYELFVFRGANRVLTTARPIIVTEVGNYEKQGYTNRDVYEYFTAMNYLSYAMVGKCKLSQTDSMLNHKGCLSVNRILVPKERIPFIQKAVTID